MKLDAQFQFSLLLWAAFFFGRDDVQFLVADVGVLALSFPLEYFVVTAVRRELATPLLVGVALLAAQPAYIVGRVVMVLLSPSRAALGASRLVPIACVALGALLVRLVVALAAMRCWSNFRSGLADVFERERERDRSGSNGFKSVV